MAEETFPPGTTTYVLGLLYRTKDRPQISEPESDEIQRGHLAHLNALLDSGRLILCGPLLDDGDLRGMLLFPHQSLEEVRELTRDDPALRRGRLTLELHPFLSQDGITRPGISGR